MQWKFPTDDWAKLQAYLTALGESALRQGVGPALYTAAQKVMTESKQSFVPVDTGALRSSGYVREPTYTGTATKVELGFGGPAAPYAVYVHENMHAHHNVGQAKYLEVPLNQAQHNIVEEVTTRVKALVDRRAA
jgi:hypothetical protein